MEDKHKEKENVWTTDNIRQECNNWNLDADVGLLKHLQQFSQNLLLDTHSTLKSLDALESELNTTYVKFSTVSNSFLSLSDTQFVENRVYEDEETANLTASKVPEETCVENGDEVIVQRLKEAINNGFKVLNDKFERIQVPESDSEDEEDCSIKNEMVLKPVNPYEDLVLPYLIGSPEFNSDDTVGLEDVPSEDEIEEALSESDKDSESEDSEPESDQSKVQQAVEEQDDIFKYNKVNSAGQFSIHSEDSSNIVQNIVNPKGQKPFETTDNKIVKNITSEIKASLKENNIRDQLFSSSSSSDEFVNKSVSNSYQDDPGSFFSKDEPDNLFQTESSPKKVPAGGISVLRPGVQLPATKIISQQATEKPKQNDHKNNTNYDLQPEDKQSPDIFKSVAVSRSGQLNYSEDEEDGESLFAQSKKPTEEDDIFSNLSSSKFNPVSKSDLKKSFWLDSEKNIIDDGDIFDSKGIFSDDEEELFSASKPTESVDKRSTLSGKSNTLSVSSRQSSKNTDEPSLLVDSDIFSTDKSSLGSNFLDVISGTRSNDMSSKTTKDNLFDDLFDDLNDDDDDLFKDILPSKNVTHETLPKKFDEIKSVDVINNQNMALPKQAEHVKPPSATISDVPKQIEQIKENVNSQNIIKKVTTENINNQNIVAEDTTEQIQSDKMNTEKVHNKNLNLETKPASSIVDFETEDSDDLFADLNQSFSTDSTFKDDSIRKEIKLFDDFSSDEDLFSTAKSSINTKIQPIPVNLSQEKKPVKDLFKEHDFQPSYNDKLFNNVPNVSDENSLFSETLNDIQSEQPSIGKPSEVVENAVSSTGNNRLANITPTIEPESTVEENIRKPDVLPKPNKKPELSVGNISKGKTENKSVITSKIEPPKTLNIKQLTVKNNEVKSAEDKPDGSILSASLRPSPGKLSAELTKNIDPTTLFPGSRPKFTKQEELPSTDTISTLQSVVKERPKIQVKRRPPSRRARQEAIRASKLENDDYSDISEVISNKSEPNSNKSPSTDEDDLFVSSDIDNKNKATSDSLDIFGSSSDHLSDLLSDKSRTVKEETKKNESARSVSEFNLLSDVETVKTKENKSSEDNGKITQEIVGKSVVQKEQKNIFDDESDDDIFGEVSKTEKSLTTSKSKPVDVGDWLNSEAKESDDFLFAQSVISTSSQSKKVKISQVQSTSVKEDKSKTNMPFEENDIFKEDDNTFDTESLFFKNKDPKIIQTPKTNFLFDDEDGDNEDIFSQSINTTSQETKPKIMNESGTHSKASGHSTQKVKLSSQQVFTDPLMLMQND